MKFQAERSLYLNDEINARSSMELISGMSKLHSADQSLPITLFITSAGGNISDAFALYEYVMKLLRPNLQTVVLGEASSMAVMIFLMGEKRYVGSMAVVKLHRFTFTPSETSTLAAKQLEKMRRDLTRSESKYVNVLVERTDGKISKETAKALLDSNAMLTPTKTVKLGLAHKVLRPLPRGL